MGVPSLRKSAGKMFDAKAHRACSSVQRSCGKQTGCQSLSRRMVQPSWLMLASGSVATCCNGDHSGLLLLQAHCQGTEHVLQEKALPGLGRPTVVFEEKNIDPQKLHRSHFPRCRKPEALSQPERIQIQQLKASPIPRGIRILRILFLSAQWCQRCQVAQPKARHFVGNLIGHALHMNGRQVNSVEAQERGKPVAKTRPFWSAQPYRASYMQNCSVQMLAKWHEDEPYVQNDTHQHLPTKDEGCSKWIHMACDQLTSSGEKVNANTIW